MPAPPAKRPPRRPLVEKKSGPPLWLKILGVTLGAVVAAHFYLLYRVGEIADGLVGSLQPFANASHRGAYYTWDGRLGFKRLHIEPQDGGAISLGVAEVELQTPGWSWVLSAFNPLAGRGSFGHLPGALGGGSSIPAADHLHLMLRGIELDINELLPPGLPDVAFHSGALFDTEGCTNLRYFVPLQLENDLRLPYGGANLRMGYEAMGSDQVRLGFDYEAPGVAATRLEMDWHSNDPRRFLDSAGETAKPIAVRLLFIDHGFIAARNQWCAEQAGVDADEFQRRHITTVRRILEVYGLRMSPETEAVYSSFARGGGTLTIEAKWPSQVPAQTFASYPAGQRWEMMAPRIWRNNNTHQPMRLEFVAARPLPAAFSGSVYDLLARNADVAAASADGSPLTTLGASLGKLAAAPASPAEPAPPAVAEKDEKAKPPPRPREPQPTPIGRTTEELIAAIGEHVEVQTDDGRTRMGTLVRVDKKVLTLQVSVSGGKADLSFSRERIKAVIANPRVRH